MCLPVCVRVCVCVCVFDVDRITHCALTHLSVRYLAIQMTATINIIIIIIIIILGLRTARASI